MLGFIAIDLTSEVNFIHLV
uniref:Uncharacterized protein n=1 Tax=Anguilla anguilla TaxID=7936 RepID=A0A0E9V709_ANGAN